LRTVNARPACGLHPALFAVGKSVWAKGKFPMTELDHEFESKKIARDRRTRKITFVYIKHLVLLYNFGKSAPDGLKWPCTGNDSKALALCAARSHIVAVR
jgi:hypothetical protein